MSFTVSSLTDYVNQNSTELLTAAMFGSETAALANVQSGIKSSAALQILTVSAVPQNGDACAFNASGSAVFTQRILTTKAVKYQDTFCPKVLQAKWTQMLLKKGQKYDESDIPRKIVEQLIEFINQTNETADWKGDTTSVNEYLNKYDGLLKIIAAASGVITASTGAAALTTSNIRAALRAAVAKIPAALQGNTAMTLKVGYDTYQMYIDALAIDNLYNKSGEGGTFGEIKIENGIYTLKAVHGLDGQNSTGKVVGVLCKDENLTIGVDLENEEETVDMWFSKDDRDVKYDFSFRRGWQIAFPQEIVTLSNT